MVFIFICYVCCVWLGGVVCRLCCWFVRSVIGDGIESMMVIWWCSLIGRIIRMLFVLIESLEDFCKMLFMFEGFL